MMNKNTTLLAGLASAALIFTACAADETVTPGGQQQTSTKTGIEITSDARMNAGITIGDTQAGENSRKGLEAIATQQTDSKLPPLVAAEDPFQASTEMMSAGTLEDKTVFQNALKNADPSLCAEMSTSDLTAECEANVNIAIQQNAQVTGGSIPLTEDDKLRSEAVTKLDLAMCSKISSAQAKQSCEIEVILQKVLADPEYCKTLTDPNHKDICQGITETQL